MAALRIELRGNDLFLDAGADGADTRRPLTDDALQRLRDWAARYERVVDPYRPDPDALAPIGREIAAFLDEGDAWLTRSLAGTGEISFEVAVAGTPDPRGRVLLDVPWELLAQDTGFLAADAERLFRVERRLGKATTPRVPAHRDLALLFMAAHVEGEGVLNYEHEEQAILQATQRLDLNLMVEESGALDFLGQTLARERPEVLHLSCHGTIAKGNPVVVLETPAGGAAPASVGDLAAMLGDEAQQPALIFLSACRTAEHGTAVVAYTQALIRAGVANALGWDGSVYDADAIAFAEVFYAHLAKGRSVAHAAAQARRALLLEHLQDRQRGRHWHLARVYLGPAGGGPLCASGKPMRPFRKGAGYREFLDKKNSRVPVATAAEFVGRRRQAQRILRAFRDGEAAGVLVHGMGSLGKSSLAARIASRMPHHEAVVLFNRYDALAVFDALVAALPPKLAPAARQDWRDAVIADERALEGALQDMLEGPFCCEDKEKKARPILLIVDDLEQILAAPQAGETITPVQPAYAAVLAAIITAFAQADPTDSRLLLTSRYTFTLGDGYSGDLAERLLPVPMPPMDAAQRDKQMHAAAMLAVKAAPVGAKADDADRTAELVERIKAAAGGNPGLQQTLSRPLLAGETDAAEQAVAAVERYLATGDVPDEASAAVTFFKRVSVLAYRAMLTAPEAAQLRAATLFSLPVPRPALHAAGAALGVAGPEAALARLEGLGLVDRYVAVDETVEAAANTLARPLIEPLGDGAATLAKAAIEPLYQGWRYDSGDLPADSRGLEAARLALMSEAPAAILNPACLAGARCLFESALDARAALGVVEMAVAALDRQEEPADLHLLRIGADCAERLGESKTQERLLRQGLVQEDGDPRARAMLLSAYASRLTTRGEHDAAETALQEAAATFERLGDVRERAVTMGKIADIMRRRGRMAEALRIHVREQLPVFERLGDVRERAVTMGYISEILRQQGRLDEALTINRKEVLPVFKRLGHMREYAVTQRSVADILRKRGEYDEALRILRDEALPAVQKLGAMRDVAAFQGRIADILQARGQLDEALRLHLEERLPVAEAVQDLAGIAEIRFKCAQIRLSQDLSGDRIQTVVDELAESFSISEQLGRPDAIGHVGLLWGHVLAGVGHPEEALSVLDAAADAFATLQQEEMVAQVRAVQNRIRGTASGHPEG